MQIAMNVLIAYLIVVIVSIIPSGIASRCTDFYGERYSFWGVYKEHVLCSALGAVIVWVILFLHQHLTWAW